MNKSLQVINGVDGTHVLLVVDGESHIMREDHKDFEHILNMVANDLWERAAEVAYNSLVLVESAVPRILADGLTLKGETLY